MKLRRVSLLKIRKRERKCFRVCFPCFRFASTAGQSCFHLASHDQPDTQTTLAVRRGGASATPRQVVSPVRGSKFGDAVRSVPAKQLERLCGTHCSAGARMTAGRGSTRRESEPLNPRLRSKVSTRLRTPVSRVMNHEKSGSRIELVGSGSPIPGSQVPPGWAASRNRARASLARTRGRRRGFRSSGAKLILIGNPEIVRAEKWIGRHRTRS